MKNQPSGPKQLPDLIYPEVRNHRVKNTIFSLLHHQLTGAPFLCSELGRATVFITKKCNFACNYCKFIHIHKENGSQPDLQFEPFQQFINALSSKHPVKHCHLTGGEPTLNTALPEMVRYLSQKSIPSSITTNGSAKWAIYETLIRHGIGEIRLSFDSASEDQFDRLTGKPGSFAKVRQNLSLFRKMLDRKETFFLIINITIHSSRLDDIPDLINFLINTIRPMILS